MNLGSAAAGLRLLGGGMAGANSPGMKATLDKWIEKPSAVVPGNAMAFAGVASPADRAARPPISRPRPVVPSSRALPRCASPSVATIASSAATGTATAPAAHRLHPPRLPEPALEQRVVALVRLEHHVERVAGDRHRRRASRPSDDVGDHPQL